jgi:hypothetical protein
MDQRGATDLSAGDSRRCQQWMSGNRVVTMFVSRDRYDAAHGGIVRHVADNIAYGRKERGRRGHEVSQKKEWVWRGARGTRAMRRIKPPQSGQRAASQWIGA